MEKARLLARMIIGAIAGRAAVERAAVERAALEWAALFPGRTPRIAMAGPA